MKFAKTSILHPFLFAIFPIIYLYSINIIEVSIDEIVFPILVSILITGIFLIISKLILKDWIKSGLIISLLVVLSFSYGHIYSLLDSTMIGELEIGRHRYLLPIFLTIFSFITVLIIRTHVDLDKIKTIINAIAITLIIITIPNFADTGNSIIEANDENQLKDFKISYDLKKLESLNSIEKPDVYYIILDGYGGTKRMKQDLEYDNYGFLSELNNRGFFTSDISSSNYPSTGWSLTSSLNMNYLPIKENDQTNTEYALLLNELNQRNEVMRNFDYLSYEIVYYRTYLVFSENPMFVDQILCQNENASTKFQNMLLRTSILGYFANQISLEKDRQSIICAFSEISSLKDRNSESVFAFIHLLLPHPPYLFGANGENIIGSKTQTVEGSFVDEEKYIDSIKYANKKILETIDKILANNSKSIIIIQSDHGYDFGINYENPSEISLKQRFSNLNAVYLPDKGKDDLYEGITPVNIFRIIFNNYFDASYEILEDRMYYKPYGTNSILKDIEFQDVTEIILN